MANGSCCLFNSHNTSIILILYVTGENQQEYMLKATQLAFQMKLYFCLPYQQQKDFILTTTTLYSYVAWRASTFENKINVVKYCFIKKI